ncbi:GOLPH3/VPS74 family protein [Actomonas aquatica]|uniref:GPP34 family phosphoprotein n=1 Tax=Actomonas aquatica TaxID=2866162 RepID=A0ABZ1CEC5_9BACT|nr:GPP34 family phosphoprotein [Opitutus sp. WL0086]WRQ89838.1 GPP34 family phosphoprotein [Opitutus sp. WL0086]
MPRSTTPLTFHEEVMLLALSRQTGAMKGGEWFEQVLGGAILAEGFAQGRLGLVRERKKDLVVVQGTGPTGDALLDDLLAKIAASERRRRLNHWLSKVAGTRGLKQSIAERLQERGIIGLREDTVLFLFTRKRYPELNPKPEEALRERLRAAIFDRGAAVTERTVVLLSILHHSDILKRIFGAREMKAQRKHVQGLIANSPVGSATAKVIEEMEAAMVAVIAASVVVVAAS